ncbi:MAG: GxxExxY protein [Chitinophagaceae bacterium]|nr:GxxExxY protein [Chitinophagaceae bacterium]
MCYKIHTTLGPGLLESVYEAAFVYELKKREIPYLRQADIPVYYEGELLDVGFRTDIIMGGKLLVEIKSVEHIEKVHHKIVINYLKLTEIKLAILVNFNVVYIKEGIYGKINGELA